MIRYLTIACFLASAAAVQAQDMPLYSVLIEGEGWQVDRADPVDVERVMRSTGGPRNDEETVTAMAVSPDGGTHYLGYKKGQAVWAERIGAKQESAGRAPYCPLRLRKEQTETEVTGIVTDRVGRIFAATPEGIHFFDPTGRFSGLIFLPAAGKLKYLGFEDDKLVVKIDETKYVRKVKTRGH